MIDKCTICWEDDNHSLLFSQKFIYINNYIEYSFVCDCNIVVHQICINEWVLLKNCCPICKSPLEEKKNVKNYLVKKCQYAFSQVFNALFFLFLYYVCFALVCLAFVFIQIFQIELRKMYYFMIR